MDLFCICLILATIFNSSFSERASMFWSHRLLSKFLFLALSLELLKCLFFTKYSFSIDPLKDPHICGRPQCETENTKFNYTSNIRYVYDYNSHIKSEFNGTGQNSSDIYISATVDLTFPTKCEGTMRLTDVELRERPREDAANDDYSSDEYVPIDNLHSNSAIFAADIQKYDLR